MGNLHPGVNRRIFSADFRSLQFLRVNGFDFNAFFDNGYLVSRLPVLPGKKPRCSHLPYGTQVMQALLEAKVPIVVHNGLLDILHLYTTFVGALPDDYREFGEAWAARFPVLFDTRFIAQKGQYQVLQHAGGLTLEELHSHLTSLDATAPVRFQRLGPLPVDGHAHGSSGFDAVLTAEVFVLEMELWLRSTASESDCKRRRAERLKDLEAELQQLGWQAIHERAIAAGVNIFKSAVQGRFGGAAGARKKLADIRADIVALEYAKEVDDHGIGGVASAWEPTAEIRAGSTSAGCTREHENGCVDAAVLGRPHKRQRSEVEAAGFVTPDALLSAKVCRGFHNRLAIVGSSPGCLHLGKRRVVSASPQPCHEGVQELGADAQGER